ncbi:hypothetical protein Bca4012_072494 [Brassica carinata]
MTFAPREATSEKRERNEKITTQGFVYSPPPNADGSVGKCGGTGIFKFPIRSAVHPNRPPSFEARPHPHKQSQIRRFFELDNCGLELTAVD